MAERFPIGKLPAAELERLLSRYARTTDPRVLVGPGIGRDAAAIAFGSTALVAKTDPITFATDRIGWYAVHINANDLAAMGAIPRWFLATVLLPDDGTTVELVERIFAGLAEACDELGITLCGGHTEITYGLTRPILVGQMLGEAAVDRLVTASGARVGDAILLTKGIAIEGTALIAREKAEELRGRFPDEVLQRCRDYLTDPGLSVVREARIAVETGGVHAMHDPTEGGLATGLREIGAAAGVGMLCEDDQIPVLAESAALCAVYGLDPLGTIASGALVLTVVPEAAPSIISRLAAAGIPATRIGTIMPAEFGFKIRRAGTISDLPVFQRDEIGKVFE